MEWMILPLKRYADFAGRSRRKEYWMFFLFCFIVACVLAVFTGGLTATTDPAAGVLAPFMASTPLMIFWLLILIPSIAVQVRRFHDQDKSGWFVLLNFIPFIGGLIVLVFMCLEGTRGPNQYGPDPKGEEAVA